jgi:hypothetical protein
MNIVDAKIRVEMSSYRALPSNKRRPEKSAKDQ